MPIAGSTVIIAYEYQDDYDAIVTKNENAIYYVMDTGKIYVGDVEFYSQVADSIPKIIGAAGMVPKMKSDGTLESSGVLASNMALKTDFPTMTEEEYENLQDKTAFLYLIKEE